MKKKILHIYFVALIGGVFLSTLLSSCLKKTDLDIKPSTSMSFDGKDLVKVMQGESSVQLFYQAFNRLGLAASVTNDKGFTIFAPTDSAMKAAGLDAAAINSFPLDSLRKLITGQISPGAYDDLALSNSVTATQVPTLQSTIVTTPTGGQSVAYIPVFVKEQGGLYFNGVKANKNGEVIKASNGYLYKVSGLINTLPSKMLYDFIAADPELSLYKEAIRIADSVRFEGEFGFDDGTGMVTMLSTMPVSYRKGVLPTVLVPTNKAFRNAGFNTVDDLRQLATKYYVGYDLNTFTSFYYSSLDSVLQHHVIYNAKLGGAGSPVLVLYNDMLTQAVNNNAYNIFYGFIEGLYLKINTPLVFSAAGNNVNVKWSNDPAIPSISVPRDASPGHPVNNFVGANGALYKIDKLFYPAVK
ncbi:fasciclin domain-containing protein [Pedobacter psychrodurus]|uniref:fasciclin domain-containing protein n=1 Tax=Pedobacter psychrodurus TaxID=2530456 RepID=UPI0029314BD1|nr:fasciclin domain-containing protein [Pedobacter psychrodurus]